MENEELNETARPATPRPAQVRYPWRATLRTVLVAAIALLPVLPDIARAADIETLPIVVVFLSVAAAIQRVLSTPSVEAWLRNYTHLSATPPPPTNKHHKEDHE